MITVQEYLADRNTIKTTVEEFLNRPLKELTANRKAGKNLEDLLIIPMMRKR